MFASVNSLFYFVHEAFHGLHSHGVIRAVVFAGNYTTLFGDFAKVEYVSLPHHKFLFFFFFISLPFVTRVPHVEAIKAYSCSLIGIGIYEKDCMTSDFVSLAILCRLLASHACPPVVLGTRATVCICRTVGSPQHVLI